MSFSRLLSETADGIRRSARESVQMARSEIHRSVNLLARSQEVMEKTRKELKELRKKKAQRDGGKAASKQSQP